MIMADDGIETRMEVSSGPILDEVAIANAEEMSSIIPMKGTAHITLDKGHSSQRGNDGRIWS